MFHLVLQAKPDMNITICDVIKQNESQVGQIQF